MRYALSLTFVSCVLAVPSSAQPPAAERVESKGGMVVCVSPPAAEVGVAILKKGGNAVDAAVAVAFAMAVTWPEAGNIGGGGFMMVAAPGKDVDVLRVPRDRTGRGEGRSVRGRQGDRARSQGRRRAGHRSRARARAPEIRQARSGKT